MNFEENKKKLENLSAILGKLQKQYKEIKGYGDVVNINPETNDAPTCQDVQDIIYYYIQGIQQQISYLRDDFYNYTSYHSQGHLPPIKGAGKMENALKVLGIDQDYQIIKPAIFASQTRNGLEIQAEYQKPK